MALESLASLLAAALSLIVAGLVLDRNPRSESNRRFAMLGLVVGAAFVGDYLSRTAADQAGALLWTRLFLVAVAFVGSAYVHFAASFRERFKHMNYLYGASVVFGLLAVGTGLLVTPGIGAARFGFGPLMLLYYILLQGMLLYALWKLMDQEAGLKPSIDKQRMGLMVVGTALTALVLPTVTILAPLAGFQVPWRLDAVAVGASALLIGYSFFMQRTFPTVKVVRR